MQAQSRRANHTLSAIILLFAAGYRNNSLISYLYPHHFHSFQPSFTLTVKYIFRSGPRDPGGTVSYTQTSPERRVISRCLISCPYLFSFPRSPISFPGWTSPERRVSFKLAQSGGPTKTSQSSRPWFLLYSLLLPSPLFRLLIMSHLFIILHTFAHV
jgi:hypothetical protein